MALNTGRRLLQCSLYRQCLGRYLPGLGIQEMHTLPSPCQLPDLEIRRSNISPELLWRGMSAQHHQTRWFRSSQALQVDVEIQSMGESISEGTIAEILKAEGDTVAEDETIAQIETDKVTIDVKAPSAGTLTELRVKVEDTVKSGQIVAVISEGGSEAEPKPKKAGGAKPSPSQNDEKHKESKGSSSSKQAEESSSQKEGDADAEAQKEPEGRRPSIKFPDRMSGGKRISQMSEEERSKLSGSAAEPPKQEIPAAKAAKESQPKKPIWYVGKEQGTKLSQSKVLSDREMEQIELGGAEP